MYPGSGNYSYNNRPSMPPPGFNGDGQGYRQEYGNQYGGVTSSNNIKTNTKEKTAANTKASIKTNQNMAGLQVGWFDHHLRSSKEMANNSSIHR